MSAATTPVNWLPPVPLPDADLEVLVTLNVEGVLDVFEAFHDGTCWRAMDAMPITWPVVSWGNKPEGVDLSAHINPEACPA